MHVIWGSLQARDVLSDPVVTIGSFDGVHIGHQQLLKAIIQRAKDEKATVVYTFDPHPAHILFPKRGLRELTSLEDKLSLLSQWNIQYAVIDPFNEAFSKITPEEFVDRYLLLHLHPSHVVVGFNFTFGAGGRGVDVLQKLLASRNVSLTVIDEFMIEGKNCSSSYIRSLVGEGQMERASHFLGRYHFVRGKVVAGDKRGRTLGFPTANIEAPSFLALPQIGVYAVQALIKEHLFSGVANIGIRPTFQARKGGPLLEVHLFNCDFEMEGEEVKVYFVSRLRDEQKFSSAEELKVQINKDCAKARTLLSL